jgi:predicted HTH transcriptional regulator
MSLDSLGVRTATRNELLTNLLAECPLPGDSGEKIGRSHLMERRGDGIQIIKRETKSLSGKDPVFELFDEAELRVTIPAAPLPNSQ